ncbi:MAG: tRNA uridine-5-carboxymethylaminomethyl(34) synthesis GTPase MnmE [Chloroflexales bacterium]|nr:tRNA uridine-5-carboxymethylaminomethyl(34) synthesis GTPase MnmE [Chloroflexales bacterium]
MIYDDTIVAIATPPGEGGIGVVRLSGPLAPTILACIFRAARPGALRSHHLRYGHIIDPTDHSVVDEALATLMRAPRSFTREDVVELSCHGGPLPLQRTLDVALAQGARLAQPGEFTLRAFANGRLDLSQAEATLDIIRAQTDAGLALAQSQLGGWLAREVRRVRAALLGPLAYFTVLVDFPEDEVEPQQTHADLCDQLAAVERLLADASQGQIYRQGARAVLVGRPNVGKSSLLNALLRADRAIVTPIAGTTRDTLEETANLAGIPVVLIDTAGITASDDPVERLGIARSRSALAAADLALLVLDASRPLDSDDAAMIALTADKPTLVVWNKCDQASVTLADLVAQRPHKRVAAGVATSALTGDGLAGLATVIAQTLLGKSSLRVPTSGAQLVSNPRHRAALERAAQHLRHVVEGEVSGVPTDLLTVDLTAALNALGEITGESVDEDLLTAIFSRFCIGK